MPDSLALYSNKKALIPAGNYTIIICVFQFNSQLIVRHIFHIEIDCQYAAGA